MAGLLLALLCLYGPLFYTIAGMYKNDMTSFFLCCFRSSDMYYAKIFLLCFKLQLAILARRDLLWLAPWVSVSHCISDFVLLLCGIYCTSRSVNQSISNQLCIPEARTTVIFLLSFGFLQLRKLWQSHEQLSREMFSHIYLLSISWTPLSMVNTSAWGARRTTPIPGSSKPPSFWSFRVLHWWECLVY